jgi:hypothetical protein
MAVPESNADLQIMFKTADVGAMAGARIYNHPTGRAGMRQDLTLIRSAI